MARRVDDDYKPPKKRYFYIILLLLFIVISIFVIRIITTYDDYEVEKTWERQDSSESNYCSFNKYAYIYSNVC